ncbi:hypothetical protein MKX03_015224 [Papaver bracteatum]|nr:hypothetical protein MKX03_015224 [Papaver bracteatum]
MSWYTDPELYIDHFKVYVRLWRLHKDFGNPLRLGDFTGQGTIYNHLTLVDNSFPWKKSDYDALVAFLFKYDVSLNCEGHMMTINRPRDMEGNLEGYTTSYFWTHDVVDLSIFGLPVRSVSHRVVQYVEGGPARLESDSRELELAAQLAVCIEERDREKVKNEALEKRVSELARTVSSLKSKSYLSNHKNI